MSHDCPNCERSFGSTRGLRSHHAQIHGEKLRDWEDCAWCGEKTINTEDSDKTFCDRDCYAQWQSENETGENHPSWEGGPVTLECEQCGCDYERKPAEVEESRFCSHGCHADWMGENHNGANHPAAKQSFFECSWCGEENHRPPANLSDGHNFCDIKCYGKWISQNRTGENHPRYTGGRPNYGRGWNDAKKESVRERDNYECQGCGMSNEEHIKEYARRLSVHHITKADNFDDPEKRNAMDNLIALCMSCHGKWERISPLQYET